MDQGTGSYLPIFLKSLLHTLHCATHFHSHHFSPKSVHKLESHSLPQIFNTPKSIAAWSKWKRDNPITALTICYWRGCVSTACFTRRHFLPRSGNRFRWLGFLGNSCSAKIYKDFYSYLLLHPLLYYFFHYCDLLWILDSCCLLSYPHFILNYCLIQESINKVIFLVIGAVHVL